MPIRERRAAARVVLEQDEEGAEMPLLREQGERMPSQIEGVPNQEQPGAVPNIWPALPRIP